MNQRTHDARQADNRNPTRVRVIRYEGLEASGKGSFERFESLTKRLVAVPKEEVDEQREANA